MRQAIKEVAQDIKDEVGQAIEQGVQSVAAPKFTPQQLQQKQQQDQQDLQRVRKWFKDLEQQTTQVRQANKQKETQRLQNQQQEKQIIERQIEEKKKQPIVNPALRWAGKFEKKGSIGG